MEYEYNSAGPVPGVDVTYPDMPKLLPDALPGPLGGAGFWGVREVRDNGTIGSLAAAVASLVSEAGEITDGTASVVNHADPDAPGSMGVFQPEEDFLGDMPGDDDDVTVIYKGAIELAGGDGLHELRDRSRALASLVPHGGPRPAPAFPVWGSCFDLKRCGTWQLEVQTYIVHA